MDCKIELGDKVGFEMSKAGFNSSKWLKSLVVKVNDIYYIKYFQFSPKYTQKVALVF